MRFDPIDLTSPETEAPTPSSIGTIRSIPARTWTPILSSQCAFSPEIFNRVMLNLIRNPNHNSGYLFRADILFDEEEEEKEYDGHDHDGGSGGKTSEADEGVNEEEVDGTMVIKPISMEIESFRRTRSIVRKLIPRNPQLDKPLLQTCHFYSSITPASSSSSEEEAEEKYSNIVLYLPHASSPEAIPYYHPTVQGVAFIHTRTEISIHYSYFTYPNPTPNPAHQPRLLRTALHLLQTLHRHGQGLAAGYVKRVHHDRILPQAAYQNTYTALKLRHAKRLVENWAEATDAAKHVFEDLGIAAFLIELWRGMYGGGGGGGGGEAGIGAGAGAKTFPGFVDVGCGNGVLVDIILREGWKGWGFDARSRKSWATFPAATRDCLEEKLLIPSALVGLQEQEPAHEEYPQHHNGIFPPHTFLISNHADELTAWTPILAALADHAPFLIIPCCSHDLSGARFRAPPSSAGGKRTDDNVQGNQSSAYATLCDWVEGIATDLGYRVEREALRIPSTRNTALVARRGVVDHAEERLTVEEVIRKYAGVDRADVARRWVARARGLRK